MAAIDYRAYPNLINASEVVVQAMSHSSMDFSVIDSNIILIAEITHLKEHLGDYFWGMLRKGQGSTYTHTDAEAALLSNYIKPCLAFYVKYEVLNDSIWKYRVISSIAILLCKSNIIV